MNMRCKFFNALLAVLLIFPSIALAGDKHWIGQALDVPQVTTITIALTWASGDTASIDVGSGTNLISVVVTMGANASINDVAAAINAALNSDDTSLTTEDILSTESKNIGGQTIPRFRDFKATVSGAVVTLTAVQDGVPFTVTTAVDGTAGNGTITTASSQAPTGKHFYNNADNWREGAVVADGDDVIFDRGSVGCFYGLEDSGADPLSFTVEASYGGQIGLPYYDSENSVEYRTTHLEIEPSLTGNFYRFLGGRCFIDIFDQNADVVVDGGTLDLVTGTGIATLTAIRGTVATGDQGSDTCVLGVVVCGNKQGGSARITISNTTTFNGSSITLYNGSILLDAAQAATTTIYNGTMTVKSGAQTTITMWGGGLIYNSTGTLTTLNIHEGGADFSQDLRTKIVSNLNMWTGTYYWDPLEKVTLSAGMDLEDCGLQDVDVRTILGRTWTATGL